MKNQEIKISVAKDFSDSPGGRIPKEGPNSGQEFRTDFLIPALTQSDAEIFIDLDGTDGYGSSFLEESFGGLIRLGFDGNLILSRLNFKSEDDESVIEEIKQYIKEAMSRLN